MHALAPTPSREPLLSAALILGAPRTTLIEMFFSLLDTVDELSVVYTEGRDARVAALCAEAELPLVERELPSWDGDFAEARNFAAEQARGTYVLAIDDDERLVGGETLRDLLASGEVSCLLLDILNLQGEAGVVGQRNVRVYRRASYQFECPLHEVLAAPLADIRPVSRPYFVHYGYANPAAIEARYAGRNRSLLARHMSRPGYAPRLDGVFLRDVLRDTLAGGPLESLAVAATRYQERVVDAGLWDEVICWGPVYGHALRKLGQGFSYTFDVARPRARIRQPVEVGFVHERDLVRFLRWWCDDVEGSP